MHQRHKQYRHYCGSSGGNEPVLRLNRLNMMDDNLRQVIRHEYSRTYVEIDLSQNNLTSASAEYIVQLCCNSGERLVRLKLYKNYIGDHFIDTFGEVLDLCPNLEELHLSHNHLTRTGVANLIRKISRTMEHKQRVYGTVHCPFWARLEQNLVQEPCELLVQLEKNGMSICIRADEKACNTRSCQYKRLIHVPHLDLQRDEYEVASTLAPNFTFDRVDRVPVLLLPRGAPSDREENTRGQGYEKQRRHSDRDRERGDARDRVDRYDHDRERDRYDHERDRSYRNRDRPSSRDREHHHNHHHNHHSARVHEERLGKTGFSFNRREGVRRIETIQSHYEEKRRDVDKEDDVGGTPTGSHHTRRVSSTHRVHKSLEVDIIKQDRDELVGKGGASPKERRYYDRGEEERVLIRRRGSRSYSSGGGSLPRERSRLRSGPRIKSEGGLELRTRSEGTRGRRGTDRSPTNSGKYANAALGRDTTDHFSRHSSGRESDVDERSRSRSRKYGSRQRMGRGGSGSGQRMRSRDRDGRISRNEDNDRGRDASGRRDWDRASGRRDERGEDFMVSNRAHRDGDKRSPRDDDRRGDRRGERRWGVTNCLTSSTLRTEDRRGGIRRLIKEEDKPSASVVSKGSTRTPSKYERSTVVRANDKNANDVDARTTRKLSTSTSSTKPSSAKMTGTTRGVKVKMGNVKKMGSRESRLRTSKNGKLSTKQGVKVIRRKRLPPKKGRNLVSTAAGKKRKISSTRKRRARSNQSHNISEVEVSSGSDVVEMVDVGSTDDEVRIASPKRRPNIKEENRSRSQSPAAGALANSGHNHVRTSKQEDTQGSPSITQSPGPSLPREAPPPAHEDKRQIPLHAGSVEKRGSAMQEPISSSPRDCTARESKNSTSGDHLSPRAVTKKEDDASQDDDDDGDEKKTNATQSKSKPRGQDTISPEGSKSKTINNKHSSKGPRSEGSSSGTEEMVADFSDSYSE